MSRPKRYRVVEKLCQEIIADPEYLDGVKARLVSGSPAWIPIEQMIWHYAYGRPVERQQIDQTVNNKGGPLQLAFLDFETFEKQQQSRISLVHGTPDDMTDIREPPTDDAVGNS